MQEWGMADSDHWWLYPLWTPSQTKICFIQLQLNLDTSAAKSLRETASKISYTAWVGNLTYSAWSDRVSHSHREHRESEYSHHFARKLWEEQYCGFLWHRRKINRWRWVYSLKKLCLPYHWHWGGKEENIL